MKIEIGNIRYQHITPTEIPMSSALSSRRVEMEKEIGKSETDAMFQILAALREQGDVPEVVREVFHTAYFKTLRQATRFGKNLDDRGYKGQSLKPSATLLPVECCHAKNLYPSDDARTCCCDDHARRPVQHPIHC